MIREKDYFRKDSISRFLTKIENLVDAEGFVVVVRFDVLRVKASSVKNNELILSPLSPLWLSISSSRASSPET